MRLGISTGALRKIANDDNFGRALSIATELPVDHIEILFARPKMLFFDINPETLKLLMKKTISLHGPFFQDEGSKFIKNDRRILDELEHKAKLLNATHITVHPDLLHDTNNLKNRAVSFAIENVKSLSLKTVLDIIKDNKNIGLAFDPNHIVDNQTLDEALIHRIVEYHLSLKEIDIFRGQKPNLPNWVHKNDVLVILETPYTNIDQIREVLWILKKM